MESGLQGLGQCAGVAGIEIDKISPRLEGFVGTAHDELEADFDVIALRKRVFVSSDAYFN
jgi:hypothetical protein